MHAKRVVPFVLVLTLSLVVYLTSFNLNAFNSRFYKREFEKYNIYGEIPNADEVNSGILLYLRDKSDDFDKTPFNEREIDHLRDVKLVMQKVSITYYISIILLTLLLILLFFLDRGKFLGKLSFVLFFSGIFTLVLTMIILVVMWLDFGSLFTNFHYIFFPQGNWLFSASDNIIKLYPSELFFDIARNIFLTLLYFGNILIGVGVLLFKND